jgi:hypothetical protein
MKFPKSPEIKTTSDYKSFKIIEWNREINKQNLDKLITLNKEKFQLHLFPILVNENMEIIDGQHRFSASKVLGSPVYYLVNGKDNSFKAVHSVNIAGKRHSLKDKLTMLAKSGDSGAVYVFNIHALFNNRFDASAIATLLINFGKTGSQVNDSIDKNGGVTVSHSEATNKVLEALDCSRIEERYTVRLCYALARISERESIGAKFIIKRVESNLSKWISPKSVDEAIRSIVTCYNYGLSEKNRIEIKGK